MIKRYVAILWTPSNYGPWVNRHVLGRYRTSRAARRRIQRMRPEEITSARPFSMRSASIYDTRRRTHRNIEYPTYLVPTVGELGWW